MRVLVIPEKRIAEFKKKDGALRREIEERCGVKLAFKDEGNLQINAAEEKTQDGGNEWIAEQVCRAIALGFEPRRAFKLIGDDFYLEEIDLAQAVHGSPKALARYKARVIGEQGKIKRNIEHYSGAFLAVGDERVAFLGGFDEIKLAKDAVFKILEGKEISTVYAFLEKYAKKTL
jgi:ribosomal RNA assembly protein